MQSDARKIREGSSLEKECILLKYWFKILVGKTNKNSIANDMERKLINGWNEKFKKII